MDTNSSPVFGLAFWALAPKAKTTSTNRHISLMNADDGCGRGYIADNGGQGIACVLIFNSYLNSKSFYGSVPLVNPCLDREGSLEEVVEIFSGCGAEFHFIGMLSVLRSEGLSIGNIGIFVCGMGWCLSKLETCLESKELVYSNRVVL